MAVAPDGTLYVADATAASATATTVGGIVRSIDPTAAVVPGVSPTFEHVSGGPGGDALTTGDALTKLAFTSGSNILFAVASNLPAVRTYTDTLSVSAAAPAQTAPANQAIITDTTAVTFRWNSVAGAVFYSVQYGTRQDLLANEPIRQTANAMDTFFGATGLQSNTTYYWRVRVNNPAIGGWSEVHSFVTQINAATGPNAPTQLVVTPNAAGIVNTLKPSFSWIATQGASGFEFELATDSQFLNLVVDKTGVNALGAVSAYTVDTDLQYNTVYYWRVKALTSTTNSDWSSTNVFQTFAKPVTTTTATSTVPGTTSIIVPTPTVTVTVPTFTVPTPSVTVTVPQGTTTQQKIAPAYIWAIIIIGAVLVIAVIVLIVRTRRSV
jgi:hypothetical protein